ncbi:rhomboid-like protein [Actinomadura xylanilytica]|uniref:rhomboid-like protein n=1 Tax=Actinomadura xylanilytica TaxID=887459 RepID=UPI00255A95B6|nr:rhomboid-like protein [Actinomadura xylanilytica]MDL4771833.1 hypothetical protein [Actinomadura xylanilytica]
MPLAFLGLFGAMWLVQECVLEPASRHELIAWASTNLANLAVNPLGTMLVSAFVAEGAQALLMVVIGIGLFPVARRFGNLRGVLLVAASHVLGTVVSEGVAFLRLELGQLSDSVRTVSDVGPSYVLSAALVAAILYGPGRVPRLLALAGWAGLAPFLFDGLGSLEVAAVGHLVAMLTGALVGGVLILLERRRATSPAERTPRIVPRALEAGPQQA